MRAALRGALQRAEVSSYRIPEAPVAPARTCGQAGADSGAVELPWAAMRADQHAATLAATYPNPRH